MFLGLGIFIVGIKLMSRGLENLSGTSFAIMLQRLTGSRVSAFLCGFFFTAFTQSSSLTSVLVVGLAEAGLLEIAPAIAVVIGANVGTTVTAQLLSFHLSEAALPLGILGIVFMAIGGQSVVKNLGRTLAGLGTLLTGLNVMTGILGAVVELSEFETLLGKAANSPLLGVLAGLLAAGIIQSSSVVAGMVLALAHAGKIDLPAGASLLIGADIGTCVTALLAGAGGGISAKRVAYAHLFFNLVSAALVLPVFPMFLRLAAFTSAELPRQLANAHTLYNLCGAIPLLVVLGPYSGILKMLINDRKGPKKRNNAIIDEYLSRWL